MTVKRASMMKGSSVLRGIEVSERGLDLATGRKLTFFPELGRRAGGADVQGAGGAQVG